MTPFQKVIKYGAIAFGIYLCIIILSAIIITFTAIFGITMGIEFIQNNFSASESSQNTINEASYEYSEVKKLNIDLNICKLDIKSGDTLKVETLNVSDEFYCNQNGKELKIKDDKIANMNLFNNENITPQVIIYIPEDLKFDEVDIETDINEVNIDKINSDKIDIKTGAGKCTK